MSRMNGKKKHSHTQPRLNECFRVHVRAREIGLTRRLRQAGLASLGALLTIFCSFCRTRIEFYFLSFFVSYEQHRKRWVRCQAFSFCSLFQFNRPQVGLTTVVSSSFFFFFFFGLTTNTLNVTNDFRLTTNTWYECDKRQQPP